jgi:hypothetical protein
MIVVAKRVGRLANRLLLFAHFIGAAAEHGLVVYNPALYPYTRYFPATERSLVPRWPAPPRRGLPSFPMSGSAVYSGVRVAASLQRRRQKRGRDVGLIRLQRSEHLDLNSKEFLEVVGRHRVVFVQDWFFRNSENCARHRDAICSHLTPSARYTDRAERVLAQARRGDRFVVGVHVRRRDYASFKGGQFFYGHETYRRLMECAEAAFAGRDVAFVVCSDAPVPDGAFSGLDVIYGDGEQCVDLYTLARCDALIGPPSTYSKWASYYGNVPLYVVSRPDDVFTAEGFHVAIGLEWKATGLRASNAEATRG